MPSDASFFAQSRAITSTLWVMVGFSFCRASTLITLRDDRKNDVSLEQIRFSISPAGIRTGSSCLLPGFLIAAWET